MMLADEHELYASMTTACAAAQDDEINLIAEAMQASRAAGAPKARIATWSMRMIAKWAPLRQQAAENELLTRKRAVNAERSGACDALSPPRAVDR